MKLAIVSTHPIQYYAPVFRGLAARPELETRVFYTWSQTESEPLFDAGFGKSVQWDVPLLDGYDYTFVPNVSKRPGSDHFRGIRNPTLIQSIEAWGADAVLVYAWNLQSHLQTMRHFKGRIPVFFRGDSTIVDRQTPLRALARRLVLKTVYRNIDVPIAVGSNNREYFAHFGVPEERIAFAPHSVDTRRFADSDGFHERRALAWRAELGIGSDDHVILYAGKLIPVKDTGLLLDAFLQSRPVRPGAHLVFVGSGPLEATLKERARGQNYVHFLPFQNQATMPSVYRLGDVFVLPSRGPETWGLALNEAMASGRAIIGGSRVGATRDLIAHERNGWVFQSGSLESLAGVVQAALRTDRAALREMGREGQRMSLAWSNESAVERIADAVLRYTPAIQNSMR